MSELAELPISTRIFMWLGGERDNLSPEAVAALQAIADDAAALRPPEGDVKAVARAICLSIGLPPDDEVAWGASDTKVHARWKAYVKQAQAALAALDLPARLQQARGEALEEAANWCKETGEAIVGGCEWDEAQRIALKTAETSIRALGEKP